MKTIIFLLIALLACEGMYAQLDSATVGGSILANQLEAFLENLEEESSFEFNALADLLLPYLENPLNINTASHADLADLVILNEIQISDLLHHRQQLGPFLSVFELQSLSSFDIRTLELIRYFVTVDSDLERINLRPREILKESRKEIYLRWERFLQQKKGFKPRSNGNPAAFLGDPHQLFLQFRGHYNYRFSYGITMQKDAGELLWTNQKTLGVDYLSYHLYARDLSPLIKYLALGDYSLSLGQGLIMHSGFGSGKSALVTSIKRGGHFIKPYTSLDESSFLRGFATEIKLGPVDLGVFLSRKKEDANITAMETDSSSLRISSLQTTGLHRTQSEIDDRDATVRTIVGFRLSKQHKGLKVHANFMRATLDADLIPRIRSYNQFAWPSSKIDNVGFDYSYLFKSLNLFGEAAYSGKGGYAFLQGMLLGLSKHVDLALLYRDLNRAYVGVDPNPFVESARASNERGLYVGSRISISSRFWLEVYADQWKHPWLTFRSDAPSGGHEYFVRATYFRKRSLEAYIQYRSENKTIHIPSDNSPFDRGFLNRRKQIRLHFRHHVSRAIELRNRIEMSIVRQRPGQVLRGFLIYQDVIFKPMQYPISFTARLAYFDTDGFAARIYAYENDILRSFSIPAYFDQGLRCYFNLRYKIKRTTAAEVRLEATKFYNKSGIGSGHDAIEGNIRSRIKVQIKHQF